MNIPREDLDIILDTLSHLSKRDLVYTLNKILNFDKCDDVVVIKSWRKSYSRVSVRKLLKVLISTNNNI